MLKCPKCYQESPESATSCSNCGFKFTNPNLYKIDAPLIQKYHNTIKEDPKEYELKSKKETVAAVIVGTLIGFILVFVLTSVIVLYMGRRY